MREPIVSIVRCLPEYSEPEVCAAVEEALNLIGGLDSLIGLGDVVLLKPNLLGPYPFETGATTNPLVIKAVALLARKAGAAEVIIGEGAGVGTNMAEVFRVTGVDRVAQEVGARLIDLATGGLVPQPVPGGRVFRRLRLPRVVLEANVIIDLPVMKTHDCLPVSLSLKNMKGVLDEGDKRRFHRWGLTQAIIDLNKVVLPELAIIDGTIGMEGPGPVHGLPVGLGVLVASWDPVAADAVAAKIMGFDPADLEYLQLAQDQGLGCADLSQIEVRGLTIEEVRRPFQRAELDFSQFHRLNSYIYESGMCSVCKHCFESFLLNLERKGKLDLIREATILLGQTVQMPERYEGELFLIGTCTRKFARAGKFLAGCPPRMEELEAFFEERFSGPGLKGGS